MGNFVGRVGDGQPVRGAAPDGAPEQALDLIGRMVAAIELTPTVAIYSFDRDGTVRFWNRTCVQLYGVAAERALGRPIASLLAPIERAEEYQAALARIWRMGQSSPARDWHMRTADGRALWIYSTMFPVYRGRELQQIFCMDVDVTARKLEESALRAVGANFQQVYEKSSDAIVLIRQDRIVDANPAALRLFRCPQRECLLNRSLGDLSPPLQSDGVASAPAAQARADQAYAEGNLRFDWRYLDSEARPFWAEVLMTSITLDHEYLFYTVIRDITARKETEQSLYLAAQVFENSHDAILLTDGAQAIIAVNRAYTDVTGYAADAIVGQSLGRHRGGIEDEAQYQRIWSEVAAAGHWQGEILAQRQDGERYPAWLSLTAIRDRGDAVGNYMAILSDITDRKRSEAHTRHLAEHDFLTDLPNRVLLLDRLSLALTAARRNDSMLAILFLDLDRFKHINDALGHHVGDLLLREVAARLVRCVRAVDTVSRQGGDEFVIILADIGGVDQAAHVAASVLQALTQEYVLERHRLNVSTSIGISIYPNDGADIDTLVKNADLAMYHAKEDGRDRFQFFNPEMNAQIVERVTFENDLRMAIREQEFELEFQPEIELDGGAVWGVEALIRWRHPGLGRLLPERFIAVAEDCGLMLVIGDWVLNEACRRAGDWHAQGKSLVVAVNLSLAQFMQKTLVDGVRRALAGSGLPPQLLELEITEAILMKYDGGALATLQALRALGVRLTLDDFGTGYSRLGHLKDYPVDKLKIDRSFINDIGGHPDQAAVVTAIIAMAHSLKMKVVAEGVETEQQLRFLQGQGCDRYQGSYAQTVARRAAPPLAGIA